MAVTSYEADGKTLWKLYISIRSTIDPKIRVQKLLIGFPTQAKAEQEDKKQLIECAKKLERLEKQGSTWEDVIDRWEKDKKEHPSNDYVATTIADHAALLRNCTSAWLPRLASELNRGDGREVLREVEKAGKTSRLRPALKRNDQRDL